MNDRTNARPVRWPVRVVTALVLFFGLFMAIGGARLAMRAAAGTSCLRVSH